MCDHKIEAALIKFVCQCKYRCGSMNSYPPSHQHQSQSFRVRPQPLIIFLSLLQCHHAFLPNLSTLSYHQLHISVEKMNNRGENVLLLSPIFPFVFPFMTCRINCHNSSVLPQQAAVTHFNVLLPGTRTKRLGLFKLDEKLVVLLAEGSSHCTTTS